YGWAILIIMVVLAVLFYLGVLNPPIPSQCTFAAGVSCITNKLSVGTGKLYLQIGQGTGHPIRITGVSCTQNNSATYATGAANILYANAGGTASTNVSIASGDKGTIADPSGAAGINNITCTDANNLKISTPSIGQQYNGKIFINYTETDTLLTRIAVGTYSAKFEA
ncbi:hypothetical protein H0N98_03980, partial [Candidatus Micrarchaeota archaeon]|nr:hypothetical protein [Candidatus Micrarchaeota archaeon]